MTNKLVVIINSLKVPKIKNILLYENKFLVPYYSCFPNPWLAGSRPPDLRSLSPLSSTEFVEAPPSKEIPDYATDEQAPSEVVVYISLFWSTLLFSACWLWTN